MSRLSDRDLNVIWHPYTQMKTAGPPVAIVRGEGARLYDEGGKEYIDAISSWWVNLHGHGHPYIAEKVSEQIRRLEHVIFAGFTHEPAVVLAERLLEILPSNQSKIFYSDDGSTAVEVAVKMAIQYWHNRGVRKKKIIVLSNSYHGDTFGAMSVSVRDLFTEPYWEFLFDVIVVDAPTRGREEEAIAQLERVVEAGEIIAFIFEPLLQGAGGMIIYDPGPLDRMIRICRDNGVVTIADEVLTGFGRTGKYFASDFLVNKPDIMCLSKGLTGGTMALGVTSCADEIYLGFLSQDKRKSFFHGHSFTGNPVACAAALASLDLLEKPETMENIRRIEKAQKSFLDRIGTHPRVKGPRQIGTVTAFDVVTDEKTGYLNSLRDWMNDYCVSRGIIIRPLGNVIYLIPPYCITNDELTRAHDTLVSMLNVLEAGNLSGDSES